MRHADDFYSTPDWVTAAIIPFLPVTQSTVVFDPCAGDGALLDSFHTRGYKYTYGIELNAERASKMHNHTHQTGNALSGRKWLDLDPLGSVDAVIVTNPPFVLAREFVEHALKENAQCVAMLLRLNWLASQGRADFLRAHTPSVYVLPKRPSFTGNGKTDATDYAWMVWDGTRPTVTILPNG